MIESQYFFQILSLTIANRVWRLLWIDFGLMISREKPNTSGEKSYPVPLHPPRISFKQSNYVFFWAGVRLSPRATSFRFTDSAVDATPVAGQTRSIAVSSANTYELTSTRIHPQSAINVCGTVNSVTSGFRLQYRLHHGIRFLLSRISSWRWHR